MKLRYGLFYFVATSLMAQDSTQAQTDAGDTSQKYLDIARRITILKPEDAVKTLSEGLQKNFLNEADRNEMSEARDYFNQQINPLKNPLVEADNFGVPKSEPPDIFPSGPDLTDEDVRDYRNSKGLPQLTTQGSGSDHQSSEADEDTLSHEEFATQLQSGYGGIANLINKARKAAAGKTQSTGWCFGKVKEALINAKCVPSRLLYQGSKDRWGSAIMFKEMAKEPAMKEYFDQIPIGTPEQAPEGAVLVFAPGNGNCTPDTSHSVRNKNWTHGHIEIRSRDGYYSDFFHSRKSDRKLCAVFMPKKCGGV